MVYDADALAVQVRAHSRRSTADVPGKVNPTIGRPVSGDPSWSADNGTGTPRRKRPEPVTERFGFETPRSEQLRVEMIPCRARHRCACRCQCGLSFSFLGSVSRSAAELPTLKSSRRSDRDISAFAGGATLTYSQSARQSSISLVASRQGSLVISEVFGCAGATVPEN